ncbi:hypothetical protein AB0K43_02240 [Kitasatospora sp. NPDC049258]|uniref:hypothetical protein n=1 Tax=Kitasatospora sp. NPDC049258 TaxID=3155394 RepID=UPI00342C582F
MRFTPPGSFGPGPYLQRVVGAGGDELSSDAAGFLMGDNRPNSLDSRYYDDNGHQGPSPARTCGAGWSGARGCSGWPRPRS